MAWRWMIGGILAVAVGLMLWWTAFILIPLGLASVMFGLARPARRWRASRAAPSGSR